MASYVLGRHVPSEFNTVVKVREQQRKLGVEADGIWGPVTEAAYQASLKAPQQPLTMNGLRMTEQARPKSITDYVTTYGGQGQREWTDTELNNMGISNSNLPKIVNPEKLAQSDKALSKAYKPENETPDKIVFDSPPHFKPYTPRSITLPHDILSSSNFSENVLKYFEPLEGLVFVKHERGTMEIDGERYFPANSSETVLLNNIYNFDFNFEREEFTKLLNDALPQKYIPNGGDYIYVLEQSKNKGNMDQKQNLNKNTLYLFNGKLYNRNEAGNIIWGAAMHKLGFGLEETLVYADWGTLLTERRHDEQYDQHAIADGWNYIYQLENNA